MGFEMWAAFVIASMILLATPGPTVFLAVSYALERGKVAALPMVVGATLGDFVAMTASLLGAGAILNTSAMLFSILKLFGAAYLIWLGVQFFIKKENVAQRRDDTAPSSAMRMFRNAFAVTALHPGGFVFFIAFVPLFIDPEKPVFMQFATLEATFLTLAAMNIMLWIVLANALQSQFRKPWISRVFRKIGGGILVAFGVSMAFSDNKQ